jgi:deazaflavin-dependent oxidoreductase (nitroreductase family)
MIEERIKTMNEQIKAALARDQTIDITTIGRKTGQPRRIEIWFHNIDGKLYITGSPGSRGWYANLLANPEFTFHLKRSVQADLPARARPITGESERREVLARIVETLSGERDFEEWVKRSPLVEVELASA